MEDAASVSSSVSRSQRYKVAMTARARQRRMRRMKAKQQRAEADAKPSSGAVSDADSNQSSVSVQSADGEKSASKSSTTCETESSKPALLLPPNSKMVAPEQQQPKRTTATMSTSRSIKSRYERGLSTKRRGTATTTTAAASSASSIVTAAADTTPAKETTTSCSPINLNSVINTQQQVVKTASPTTVLTVPPCSSINHLLPNSDALHLSPDEIRDATNFTSVQFSCSTDGEVEIMGDADYCTDDNTTAHGRNDALFVNNVWDTAGRCEDHLERENDICFKKEAAGIVGLLTPEMMVKAGEFVASLSISVTCLHGVSILQSHSFPILHIMSTFTTGLMAPDGDNAEDDETPDISGDSPTGITSLNNSTSNLTFFPDDPASFRDVTTWHGVRPINNTTQQQTNDNKQHKETMKLRMIQPSSQLAELLSQINRNANSTPKLHRAYVTRRKNACGALKILSAKLENRLKIAWTVGVLDALASVLRDVTITAVSDNYCNVANIEGRNRTVATLLNLSTHKKNRMLISSHEGLMAGILSCIEHDEGESRQGCCTVLLYLAKTAESRPLLLRCPGLIEVLARVIDVKRVREMATTTTVKKKSYQNRFLKEFEMAADGITAAAADNNNNAVNTMIDTVEEGLSESEDDSSSVGSSNGSSSGSDTNADESDSEDETEDEGDEDSQSEAMDDLSPKRMEICFKTPQQERVVEEVDYDADPNRFLHGARLSIFAALLCLVKNKENAVRCIVDCCNISWRMCVVLGPMLTFAHSTLFSLTLLELNPSSELSSAYPKSTTRHPIHVPLPS